MIGTGPAWVKGGLDEGRIVTKAVKRAQHGAGTGERLKRKAEGCMVAVQALVHGRLSLGLGFSHPRQVPRARPLPERVLEPISKMPTGCRV